MVKSEAEELINFGKIVKFAVIALLIVIIFFSSFYIVSAGERGVLSTLGNPSMDAKSEGLHLKIPIIQTVKILDVKTQKYEADASAASNDLQGITTKIAVNYHLTPDAVPRLYKEIGIDYKERVIQPAVQEVVKASTAQYTAEELVKKRPQCKDAILQSLKDRLVERGIIVEDISIVDFAFSDSFNEAIEAKVTAEQNALAAKNKLEQVKYEAQQRITAATAEAEAIRIQAQAIQSQGGADYVKLQAITKWNGILPQITSGVIPFIDVAATAPTPAA